MKFSAKFILLGLMCAISIANALVCVLTYPLVLQNSAYRLLAISIIILSPLLWLVHRFLKLSNYLLGIFCILILITQVVLMGWVNYWYR